MAGSRDAMAAICPQGLISFVKRVSPSKSMTGLFGGVVFGALTAIYWPSAMLRAQALCMKMGITNYPSIFKLFLGIGTSTSRSYFDLDIVRSGGLLDFEDLTLPTVLEDMLPTDFIGSTTVRRAAIGAVLSLFAILGDLVESSVKRASGRKDSGKLLPGHGGLLDRFDSTFLTAVIYWHWCLAK